MKITEGVTRMLHANESVWVRVHELITKGLTGYLTPEETRELRLKSNTVINNCSNSLQDLLAEDCEL